MRARTGGAGQDARGRPGAGSMTRRLSRRPTALAALALAAILGTGSGAPAVTLDATGSTGAAAQDETPEEGSPERSPEVARFVAVDAPAVVLTGVKLIDGTGAPAREGMTVVVRGERIVAVGAEGEVDLEAALEGLDPEAVETLELSGHTVVPGFVGLHNHSYYTAAGGRSAQLDVSGPRLYLASGVTTIRTTGSNYPYNELNLKAAIEAGEAPGPTIFVTGPYLTGPGGSMDMARLGSPEDARRVVRYWAEEGVSWFKAYTMITRDQLGAAIDEAHAHGVKVTAHLCSVTYGEAVALGIDNLEHGLFAATDYVEDKEPDRCPPDFRAAYEDLDVDSDQVQETFRAMIDNDVPMTSTLAVYEMYVRGRSPMEERSLEVLAPEIARAVEEMNRSYVEADEDSDRGMSPQLLRTAMDYELAFVRAGGLLAAGVDPTGYGAALPGFGDQHNFELLVEAGFTPVETIRIMSANGARVLGIDGDVGTVEPGKVADLVVIDGDPEARPADVKNVTLVFKKGLGFDSKELIESVKGIVGIQ